jgi:hypothetical protein
MRVTTLATGLALTIAATFSLAPAMAEMGGPIKNAQGQCKVFGSNNQNLTYYHWDACPKAKTAEAVIVHRHRHHRA